MTARDYCFTVFLSQIVDGFDDSREDDSADGGISAGEQAECFLHLVHANGGVKYIVGQLERCPKTRRLHIQGQ